MRRGKAEQTTARHRRILSAARRLHRALVVGQGAPEDFYGAEALFIRSVRSQMDGLLGVIRPYRKISSTFAIAGRAMAEARRVLMALRPDTEKGGFYAAVDSEGNVNRKLLRSLLEIDQDVGGKLLHLTRVIRQLKRRRSPESINLSLREVLGVLSELKEVLTRRRRFTPSPVHQLK
jgi:hypothetical protein